MSTTVTLRHITKLYGNLAAARRSQGAMTESDGLLAPPQESTVYALDDVTLTVRPGETLGILGPSGCGKTTLLRIAAGLESPTSGQVLYDNEDLRDIPMDQRGIGMVFQNYALYPHLPGIDNIGFFLRLHKREIEIPARVREISEMMQIDLKPLLSRKPPTLSGGERQRVAIARCLARDPRLFLFDEPFSNLDAKVRTSARVELKRLLQRYQVTSIYVTHDQVEAIALSDRIAVLNKGQLMQIGTFAHLYETPRNVFVAGFLGKPPMNLFDGYAEDGMWIGKAFDWGPIRRDFPDGTRIVLGIRPEHIRLDDQGSITATVTLIEPHFSERVQFIHVQLGPHTAAIRVPLEMSIHRDQKIRLSIPPEQVHLFDQATGQRIG